MTQLSSATAPKLDLVRNWIEVFARVLTAFALLILFTSGPKQLCFCHFPKLHMGVLPSWQVWKPSHNRSLFTDSQQGEDWPRVPQDLALQWLQHAPTWPCWTAFPPAKWFPAPTGNSSAWAGVSLLYVYCACRGLMCILPAAVFTVGSSLPRAGTLYPSPRAFGELERMEKGHQPLKTLNSLSKRFTILTKLDGTLVLYHNDWGVIIHPSDFLCLKWWCILKSETVYWNLLLKMDLTQRLCDHSPMDYLRMTLRSLLTL